MKEIEDTISRKSLSIKQKRFLVKYRELISISAAAKAVGIRLQLVRAWLARPNTLFCKTFNEIKNQIQNDERFSKAAGLERLYRCLEMAFEAGDYMGVKNIQDSINKMIEGNIAVQKTLDEKKTEVTVKVLDFTKRLELPQNNVIDITPSEIVEDDE